ncbi:MAG: DUF1156 domain-containing protein [Bacteroidales bacterium]
MPNLSDFPKRLIEVAFPLKQTSLDSVHEKNVRHGHISTLHIWPARRPLAACRAALIATLLPDPGDPVERKQILEKLGGKLVQKVKRKKTDTGWVEEVSEETEGGILHWGRESGPDLDWFREKIREAYGGRAPKVLDPFAGGGAIPLEAMRLGCEATAGDINPVAWFILKCTLEYPQKLAGQTRPLPDFALQDREFMQDYLKSKGFSGAALEAQLIKLGLGNSANQTHQAELPFLLENRPDGISEDKSLFEADLAWHVRAWGRWVLKEARKELAPYYPTYADFEPLVEVTGKVDTRPMQLVPLKADGSPDIDALNAEYTPQYLAEKRNPRWVAKPTVAYLWARTVTCKNCRATIPLLKTRWLCKKEKKRVVLSMQPNSDKTGVIFGLQKAVPIIGKTTAEKKANDAKIGSGTMSRSGATCPCCGGMMTREDLQLEGISGRMNATQTASIIDGIKGKEYRPVTDHELAAFSAANKDLLEVFSSIPFGLPEEPVPQGASRSSGGSPFTTYIYGLSKWSSLFNSRQLISLGVFSEKTRLLKHSLFSLNYPKDWVDAIVTSLAICVDRVADRNSSLAWWQTSAEKVGPTFTRFALSMTWDYIETFPWADSSGGYLQAVDWVAEVDEHLTQKIFIDSKAQIKQESAINKQEMDFDIIVTDPPYYDAIPYSDLMDFYYVWLRRILFDLTDETQMIFKHSLSPKWDHQENNGELIDDASRFEGDNEKSKANYEDGMFRSFQSCFNALQPTGKLVIVFAHKQPEAWETLVSAIIRSGFVVDGSWPIQTERVGRMRSVSSAALSSSVWLVCKKRNPTTRPGWDNKVMDEMRISITNQLRDFWDAGIRGPDFVWAATGPAMESYSQYPIVKKANEPGAVMTVSEFLTQVRRMVVDFVVGRVLTGDGGEEVSGLDNITTYYLLHRHDFGLNDASAGPCILYAVSCGLLDKDLADRYDLLARRGGKEQEEPDEVAGDENGEEEGSGSSFRLKSWNQRKNPRMGYDLETDSSPVKLPLFPDMEREIHTTREIPLIDQVHRLMHIWKTGDVTKVNEYLDLRGLRRNPLFHQLLQALIELAPAGSEERSLMESISNHVGGKQINVPKLFDQ